MTDWITVVSLVLVGILLIIAEIIFVPGTTIVGILGFLSGILGVYLSFDYFGSVTGGWVAFGSSVAFGIALYYSFKSNTWDKFSLKDTNSGKVNEDLTAALAVGDEGLAISVLKPVGKAEFGVGEFEVKTLGDYTESGTRIKIIKLEKNNIVVEPIN